VTRCARCGRKLTDPVSIKRGYGPVCWERVQAEKPVKKEDIVNWLKKEEEETNGFLEEGKK